MFGVLVTSLNAAYFACSAVLPGKDEDGAKDRPLLLFGFAIARLNNEVLPLPLLCMTSCGVVVDDRILCEPFSYESTKMILNNNQPLTREYKQKDILATTNDSIRRKR